MSSGPGVTRTSTQSSRSTTSLASRPFSSRRRRSRDSATGSPIPTRRDGKSSKRKSDRRCPSPKSSGSRRSAWWPARRRAATRAKSRLTRSSRPSRPEPRSSSPRESRSSSSRLNVLVDHPRQLIVRSEHAALVLKAVGSPNVKMLFDIYHQQISEGNLTGNIRRFRDLIGYFQLADHPGRHEPTTGEINYPFVLWTIHEIGYTGAIGMEMSPKGRPDGRVQGDPEGRRPGIAIV